MALTRPKITDEANGTNAVEFIALSGSFQYFGQTHTEITRPGVDGHAFRQEGKRAMPSVFVAVRDVSSATAQSTKLMVAGFRGALCTVKDEYGTNHTNVMVREVQLVEERPLGAAVGGLASPAERLLTWHITLQKTYVAET